MLAPCSTVTSGGTVASAELFTKGRSAQHGQAPAWTARRRLAQARQHWRFRLKADRIQLTTAAPTVVPGCPSLIFRIRPAFRVEHRHGNAGAPRRRFRRELNVRRYPAGLVHLFARQRPSAKSNNAPHRAPFSSLTQPFSECVLSASGNAVDRSGCRGNSGGYQH
jgi:hypothetical protein